VDRSLHKAMVCAVYTCVSLYRTCIPYYTICTKICLTNLKNFKMCLSQDYIPYHWYIPMEEYT